MGLGTAVKEKMRRSLMQLLLQRGGQTSLLEWNNSHATGVCNKNRHVLPFFRTKKALLPS